MIRHVPNFFGLGFGVEFTNTSEGLLHWRALCVKVFLGFWVCNWIVRMSKKREMIR